MRWFLKLKRHAVITQRLHGYDMHYLRVFAWCPLLSSSCLSLTGLEATLTNSKLLSMSALSQITPIFWWQKPCSVSTYLINYPALHNDSRTPYTFCQGHRRSMPSTPLPFSHVNIWNLFKMHQFSTQDAWVLLPTQTIQAPFISTILVTKKPFIPYWHISSLSSSCISPPTSNTACIIFAIDSKNMPLILLNRFHNLKKG